MVKAKGFVSYQWARREESEMEGMANRFNDLMGRRRSIRHFSTRRVPRVLIERAIQTASSAPSGAHRQPWTFVAISEPAVKRKIRLAAEREEKINYKSRMTEEWLSALEPLGTNWEKPFLEDAPWLVAVFSQSYGIDSKGNKRKHYYVQQSVGIACGFLITAIHAMGLATLTHTPSPMAFLGEILQRPPNEKAFMLFPVGYPADDASVPRLIRKSLKDVAVWVEDA